jgi:hypothetical protein
MGQRHGLQPIVLLGSSGSEAGQVRENEVWETAANNSKGNTVLMNDLIKST